MTLHISNEAFYHRQIILRRVSEYKYSLVLAYKLKKPKNIYTAKKGLIRQLYRLLDSPELGPPPAFLWTLELRAIISSGMDPRLPATITTLHTFREVAGELERSLDCLQ